MNGLTVLVAQKKDGRPLKNSTFWSPIFHESIKNKKEKKGGSSSLRNKEISSSKERGVKKASLVAPIMLGLEMCALPWGTLIQACLTQYQVRVRMSQKKVPKMAVFGVFLPKNHLKLGVEP